MKKRWIVSFALAVLMTATLAACGKTTRVTLVDFPAAFTEQPQKLGSTYTLRRAVEDDKGNSYTLAAEVKTKAGGAVSVVSGRFELTDVGGYVVTYTAAVTETDKRVSVVTVPCVDLEAPVIHIPTPENGLVDTPYTLPVVSFVDLAGVASSSVKVYLVEGETLTEQTLTGDEQPYAFTPTAAGIYRIEAYAKDAAGNDITRTADFIVDTLREGEAFDPASLGARAQLRTNKDPNTEFTFVPAADNTDPSYGGAYWRVVPKDKGWVNTFLTPRLEPSAYAEYDLVTFWIYIESDGASDSFSLPVLNDGDSAQTLYTKKWTLLELDAAKFAQRVTSQYLYAINYGGITGARIGEIMGRHTVAYTADDFAAATVTDKPATVSFTVSGTPAEVPYTVTITDENGTVVDDFTKEGNAYEYQIAQAGSYTLTVAPADPMYHGTLTKPFTVVKDERIEVSKSYPDTAEAGTPLTLHPAKVVSAGKPTADAVTRKVYAFKNDAWEDATAAVKDDAYVPTDTSPLKIVYSFGALDEVVFNLDVAKRGEIFDPAAPDAESQLATGGTLTYIPAEENDDPDYGGPYWEYSSPKTDWMNLKLTPRLDWAEYEKYDIITFRVTVVSTKKGGVYEMPMFNDGAHKQVLTEGVWSTAEVSLEKFLANKNAQYFLSFKFSAEATAIRIGEITAKTAVTHTVVDENIGTVNGSTPAAVSFGVTTLPANIPYAVEITDAAGEAVKVTATETGVSCTIAEVGTYTRVIRSNTPLYYGVTEDTFAVKTGDRIEVSGEYAATHTAGTPLALLDAVAMIGDAEQTEKPVRKLYAKTSKDGAFTEVNVTGDTYTPAAGVRLKIEYTYTGLDTVSYTIDATVAGEVFNPGAVWADGQIAATGNAFTDTVKTFLSAEENTDTTYSGAYWQFTVPGTSWASIKLTPKSAVKDYASYDYVTIWLYIGQKAGVDDGVLGIPFGNSAYHRRRIQTGAWTKIVLEKAMDGMTGKTADNVFHTSFTSGNEAKTESFDMNKFLTASWAADTEIVRIGEITAKNYDDKAKTQKVLFDPASDKAAGAYGTNSGSAALTDDNPAPAGGYAGKCVKWTPPASGWTNFYLRPTDGTYIDYAGYSRLKLWIYVKTDSGTPADIEWIVFNDGRCRQKIKTDTWVEMTLDLGKYADYVATNSGNKGNPYLLSQNNLGTRTVYIGTATAVTYA